MGKILRIPENLVSESRLQSKHDWLLGLNNVQIVEGNKQRACVGLNSEIHYILGDTCL